MPFKKQDITPVTINATALSKQSKYVAYVAGNAPRGAAPESDITLDIAPDIASDCKHYLGDRPCVHNRLCKGCNQYDPYVGRICIIKIGALGDVIRTLCILPQLRRLYPQAHITWVSKPQACRMLEGHPQIDRLLSFDVANYPLLCAEHFDLLINLDKEALPCAWANTINAKEKLGMGLSGHGTPVPINAQATEYFKLGLSDDLKFNINRKSYPQLIYEALGWNYQGQRYQLAVDLDIANQVHQRLIDRGWQPHLKTIGINVGAGSTFANKMWPASRLVDVIVGLRIEQPDAQIMLIGGPQEQTIIQTMVSKLSRHHLGEYLVVPGTDYDPKEFVSVVDHCDVLFSGDTMAMHVAIARNVGVVVFFGPTCQQEIDLFGLGEKIVTQVSCSPCYKKTCDMASVCVGDRLTQEAVKAITSVLAKKHNQSRELVIASGKAAG